MGLVVTTTAAVPDAKFAEDAVIVALPAAPPADTWKTALVLAANTVTFDGTDATFELLLVSVTTCPFPLAGELNVTVMLPVLLARRFSGFGEREMDAVADKIVIV